MGVIQEREKRNSRTKSFSEQRQRHWSDIGTGVAEAAEDVGTAGLGGDRFGVSKDEVL